MVTVYTDPSKIHLRPRPPQLPPSQQQHPHALDILVHLHFQHHDHRLDYRQHNPRL